MKKIILALAFCLISTIAMGEESGDFIAFKYYDYEVTTNIRFESEQTRKYGFWLDNRKTFMQYLKDINCWKNGGCLYIEVDYIARTYTEETVPIGDVYCGNGKWLIHYEQNGGYMPIWIE